MDLENATAAPIVRKVGDRTFEFPRLTMGDLGKLLAVLREDRRKALLRNLEDLKPSMDHKLEALRAFDERPLDTFDGLRWARSPEGTSRTLLASLKLAKPDATEDDVKALPIAPLVLSNIAFELWGFTPTYTEREGAGDGSDPKPETTTRTTSENTATTPPSPR